MSKKFPPHLPPPACSVPTHYTFKTLQKLLAIVFLGALAGISAALAALAWALPSILPVQQLSSIEYNARHAQTPNVVLLQRIRQRVVRVYDVKKRVGEGFYSQDAMVGEAMMLSSDGWGVIYDPLDLLKDTSTLEGIDYQHIAHPVKTVVRDAGRHLVYVKFDGAGFHIVPFFQADRLTSGLTLWSFTRDRWAVAEVDGLVRLDVKGPLSPTEPQYAHALLLQAQKHSILLTDQGELVGFTDGATISLPAWIVEHELQSILQQGKLPASTVAWKGSIVSQEIGTGVDAYAFYVESAPKTGTGIRSGDLILRVNGKPVDPVTLSRDLLLGPDPITFRVRRGKEEIDMVVKKGMQ